MDPNCLFFDLPGLHGIFLTCVVFLLDLDLLGVPVCGNKEHACPGSCTGRVGVGGEWILQALEEKVSSMSSISRVPVLWV